ncbi:VanZ family protein [Rhodoferax aquaticus]|uniref:VanZ family protein n=1 Tax=Rhodoferax aquaticus TaxID=2527691 RepID=A0A515EUL0_9BURK|nr:VanZ family protein [Rhodoferax aquaticus]QDL56362.1 VanZ family protein [Rhodoferax aquaticus]
MHKTTASPLALMYVLLVVYASLYPFTEWRDPGLAPWHYVSAPLPKYWTGFDVGINIAGYVPLGSLLALGAVRSGRSRHVIIRSTLWAFLLAGCMEALQTYLPARVPSKEDLFFNTVGGLLGAGVTVLLERWGAIDHWSRIRARWFVPEARGGLVLLASWPVALLFPAAIPFGLGQVLERLEGALADTLDDTPFFNWLPVRDEALLPLVPAATMVCVALGLLIPCLLGFCVVRSPLQRIKLVLGLFGLGIAVTSLSAALSWGPAHAWAWLDLATQVGMGVALLASLGMAFVPWRVGASLALVAIALYLNMLNQAPENPYFAATLQAWEQGRFIRFQGLAQWIGWLWPYAALVYVLSQVARRDTKT